ncbi:MAG: hypothetical protein U0S48_06650 [Solirubrobacteraceae bacterium]
MPCISQISRYDMDRWGGFWRFTGAGASRLFGAVFGAGAVEIAEYGMPARPARSCRGWPSKRSGSAR